MSRGRWLSGLGIAGLMALFPGAAPGVATAPADGHAPGHCSASAEIVPLEGASGWFRIVTPLGTTIARWPVRPPETAAPAFVIRALDATFDMDGNDGTSPDTLVVPVGSTVRWALSTGIHTLTNGRNSSDPDAGTRFDYLLDEAHPTFDSTFTAPDTIDFFCFFHEPLMSGVLIVSANASVPDDPLPGALTFARPPVPNPSRGTVFFSIAVPRERRVDLDVLDVTGRHVATLHRGSLPAGEYPFVWRGRNDAGAPVATGVYVIHLQSGSLSATRRVSLLR